MYRVLLLTLLLLSATISFSQEVSETEKIESLCKIWGYLKYFHPTVAEGDMDWDAVFVSEVNALYSLKTTEAINRNYINLVNGLGDIKAYPVQMIGYDLNWNFNNPLESLMRDTKLISPELMN